MRLWARIVEAAEVDQRAAARDRAKHDLDL